MVFQNHRASGPCTVDRLATDEITFIGQPPADLTPGAVTVVLTVAECRLVRLKGFFRHTDIDARGSQCWRVALQHTSRDVEDNIQQMIVDQFERAQVPLVIVLDCSRLSRTRLRRDLHRLGQDVVLFDNALEALWFMDDSPDRFSTMVVDFSFVSAQGSEAISFLRDRWPEQGQRRARGTRIIQSNV